MVLKIEADKSRNNSGKIIFLVLSISLLLTACRTPQLEVFHPEKLSEIDASIEKAISDHKTPGGVFWLERKGLVYSKAYGNRSLEPKVIPTKIDTIYDAASLTKVVATTPAVMLLIERGQILLDAPVHRYLDDFKNGGKESITIRHLMTHTSGLRPGIGLTMEVDGVKQDWEGYDTAIALAKAEKVQHNPGSAFIYSDINYILLGEIVQQVSGRKLEDFTREEIFQPLGMMDTGYLPSSKLRDRIAPTKWVDGQMLQGIANNPICRRTGGVMGHAGMFTTAADLAKFARMMLNKGELNGVRLLQSESVDLMTSVQSPANVDDWRGLGWDMDTSYSKQRGNLFPLGGFGHTGFTGSSLWIDPYSQSFVIFMSNRVHPDGTGDVLELRRELGTLSAEALGFQFEATPRGLTKVRNGIDVLEKQNFASLNGLKLGLITNHTGRNRRGVSTIDLLFESDQVELVALFSPEHGIRGKLDEKVGDSLDEKTGLTIRSLYGDTRTPTPEALKDLDALAFDIQDIGCRFYTYISTMGLAMEAAAENHKQFFVLDRVNPINGTTVEGPLRRGEFDFIAYHDIPIRHGMTVGELAQMIKVEKNLDLELTVIPVQDWRRDMLFDETGLPWINPSPNMRSLTQAILYPGIGLLETTKLSVGRGTDTPFEIIGAPYIDHLELAEELNRQSISGVRFVPIQFTPTASKLADQACRGVNIILTDRENCPIVDVGIAIAHTLNRLYAPDFDIEPFNRLLKHPSVIEQIQGGQSWRSIVLQWKDETEQFKERRKPFLLYK
ncbi:MAG: DUF1343 domain-containing protein [Verrucomicrobia bacterium]|nr:DUF1343 domain-containing protein [Verrucomicrobiota bacterium]MDA1065524.1 DUF1343 domain-containing protein [Verrucomicrobiota bacterium]